jgi:hypothetical protein
LTKCLALVIDKGNAKFHRAIYDGTKGRLRRYFFFKGEAFGIPDKVNPIMLDIGKPFRRNRYAPIFIVNKKTLTAIGVSLIEKTDPTLISLLTVFSEVAFYKAMVEKIKLTIWEVLPFIFTGMFLGFIVAEIMARFLH